MFQKLEKPGQKWGIWGYVSLFANIALMAFYTVVTGWIIYYFVKFVSGSYELLGFGAMLSSPSVNVGYMLVAVISSFVILSFGLQKGLERVTKVMMIALLILLVVLAGHSMTLSGAKEGLKFYLVPDFSKIDGTVIVGAMNQAFFTLSLGIGSMAIFGSYINKDHSLLGESIRICALDTFVAIISGLIIFPACFSYGVDPGQGPALIFVTLPTVFASMTGGRIWGTLFFVFMVFASFSTVTGVFENIVTLLTDNFGISRQRSIIFNLVLILVFSIPCVLGYNIWSNVHIIGARDVLDSEDFLVSSLLLPIGAFVIVLFCVIKAGWGFENFANEVNTGKGIRLSPKLKFYLGCILPVMILMVLFWGLIPAS